MSQHSRWLGAFALVAAMLAGPAAAQRSWDGGNATFIWGDFGNWNPDGNPNANAISIGDLAAAINDTTLVDAAYSINSLTITGGADVVNSTDDGATNDFRLLVNGATTISGAGSSIVIYGGNPEGLDTNTLTINSGAALGLNSQPAAGLAVVQVDSGALTNNVGGTVLGNGRIDLTNAPVAATTLLNNEGTLTASYFGFMLLEPPTTTLQITATSANARVDLDGTLGGNGIVNVNRNATLDIDVPISDFFSGDLNLSAGATLDIAGAWTIDSATVDVNTPGILVGTGGPAAHLAGGAITMTGGTLTLDDGLDGLVVDAAMSGTGGVINNSGTMTFNANTSFQAAVDFNMIGGDSKLVVNSPVNIHTPDFNLDGTGSAGNVTRIDIGGNLNLDLGAGADEDFQHTINLHGGELHVTTADNTWSLNLGGVINAEGGAVSTLSGETFFLAGTGGVNVAPGAQLNITTATQITGSPTVNVNGFLFLGIGATEITGTPTFNIAAPGVLDFATVTYANSGAVYTGDGIFRKGVATINAATTWSVATVDLDDGATTLNDDLTINADSLDDLGDGVDSLITISDDARLTVNIAGGGGWTLDPAGTITYNGDAQVNHYLVGSDVTINGTINHSGDGRILARIDVGASGVLNIVAAGLPLILGGGDDTANPNTIAGGTINGPGYLGIDGFNALHGFGTINADLGFHGNLKADNGILNVNGALLFDGLDDPVLGTADADGILNVANAWNTDHTSTVELQGGELRGATITNDGAAGINGFGLLSAPVINNTRIDAEGGTLIVETAANGNDWDGAGGTGQLNAIDGDLEIRDDDDFSFTGTVNIGPGRIVFARDFILHFEPGSTLSLTNGRYRAQIIPFGAGVFGGTIVVNPGGPSTLELFIEADFLNLSTTTLNDDLVLDNTLTTIRVGADFAGSGALVNLPQSNLLIEDGVVSDDLGVLIRNLGAMGLGAQATAGQVSAVAFQQVASGSYGVDLGGTGLSDFDRLGLTGTASLDGRLIIHGIGGYVPMLGDTFDILSAFGGVNGSFAEIVQPINMPAGLVFDVMYSPTLVQLMVVPQLLGDYNQNGVVEAADYTVWRNTLGAMVASFTGADGDGSGTIDAADYDVWKAHFGDTADVGSGQVAGAAPEPTCLILVCLACAAPLVAGCRRR